MILRILHLVVLAALVLAAADVYKIKYESTLQADEREYETVLERQDLTIDDADPAERPGSVDDLGELAADVVKVA